MELILTVPDEWPLDEMVDAGKFSSRQALIRELLRRHVTEFGGDGVVGKPGKRDKR